MRRMSGGAASERRPRLQNSLDRVVKDRSPATVPRPLWRRLLRPALVSEEAREGLDELLRLIFLEEMTGVR